MGTKYSIDLRHIIDLLKDTIKRENTLSMFRRKIRIYDTSPWEFLAYCRQDLNDNSERGRANALSNAKRAIECRADEILKLVNLKHIASRRRWGLPYKLQVLKTFGIAAPAVLISYITSRRNILEHEYVKPKTAEEIQHIADITELFLSASDGIVKEGYIQSVEFTREEEVKREKINARKDKSISYEDEYNVNFDLNAETITFIHKKYECLNEHVRRTGKISSAKEFNKRRNC